MKKWIGIVLALSLLLCFAACGKADDKGLAGKNYIYEKEGFGGGEFAITINGDGTFNYYEGTYSSYIGTGEWTFEDDLVTLTDDDYMGFSLENYFHFDGTDLIFIEENSTNFSYVEVKDGEKFLGTPIQAE